MNIKKGDEFELNISSYAFEGRGIARIKSSLFFPDEFREDEEPNYVVFVDGSYPGDTVKAKLTAIKKNYAEAKVVEVINPSSDRIKPDCIYFNYCGGCKQQDISYEAQLRYKQMQVKEVFQKIGGVDDPVIEPIKPSENIFFYRNKMEFSFTKKRWLTPSEIASKQKYSDPFALGLHVPGLYDKVINVENCLLQSELSNRILNFTRKFFIESGKDAYDTKTHTGFLRNLVIRQSQHLPEVMVNLVTFYEDDDLVRAYSKELVRRFKQVTTVVNNINLKKAAVAVGDFEKVFIGDGIIHDKIGNYKFRISSNSFFQTNTKQAEVLYQTAVDFAQFNGKEIVYDLYSGAGTISIFISKLVKEVVGFETVRSAVEDAHHNLELNNVNNVECKTADLNKSFLKLINEYQLKLPETVIIDPPRSGMHKTTISDVVTLSPFKIVYISCNPATQARDVKDFIAAGYKLVKMCPVDMFPHTYHIENAALLIKA